MLLVAYIIDDDPDDREWLVEAITMIDPTIECFTASNGQEGLNKLEMSEIAIPSIIFLDLNMPRIDGRKFLIALKKNPVFAAIPVIIYTTSSDKKDIAELTQLGAVDYLVKQPDLSQLKDKLAGMLAAVFSTQ